MTVIASKLANPQDTITTTVTLTLEDESVPLTDLQFAHGSISRMKTRVQNPSPIEIPSEGLVPLVMTPTTPNPTPVFEYTLSGNLDFSGASSTPI